MRPWMNWSISSIWIIFQEEPDNGNQEKQGQQVMGKDEEERLEDIWDPKDPNDNGVRKWTPNKEKALGLAPDHPY